MKLILLCTAVVLLTSAVELARLRRRKQRGPSIAQTYRAANITLVPESILQVYFDDVNVTIGSDLTPTQTQYLPIIEFDADEGCYYTFCAISPDWPYPCNPFLANGLIALYANLYGCSDGSVLMEDSCAIASWRGPTPTPGSGPHRYLLYVIKQNELIDTSDEAFECLATYRVLFNLTEYINNYNLDSQPVAGTFFYAKYPDECDAASY